VIDAVLMGRASHLSMMSAPSGEDYGVPKRRSPLWNRTPPRASIHEDQRGERQLVLIARALVQETPVLLLDEPSSHLDYKNQIMVLDIVRGLARKRGLTVLMTLHDPNLAMTYGDSTVLIHGGRVALPASRQKCSRRRTCFTRTASTYRS
jgi:iron complex transport system ATP-binding protein